MPRPSKHVSPDTLGGRIRAAREELHLSLADVAGNQYSTSLISQIERNRVDPSQESLHYLAERLHLPLTDLEILAQQHRASEVEARQYKSYEDFRVEITQFLKNKEFQKAICAFQEIIFPQLPLLQRWRLAALRGQCYFEQKKFLKALQDFTYAIREQPKQEGLSAEQQQELMLLHLHLAATYRELGLEGAFEEYEITLQMMNQDTPFGYVAEAHWGMAVIAFTQAYYMRGPLASASCRADKLRIALEHAENAHVLYRSIHQPLQAALVLCQMAQIERELGRRDNVRRSMHDLIEYWTNTPQRYNTSDLQAQKSRASILSAAASTLAALALEDADYEEALHYAEMAVDTSAEGQIARQADAHIMLGRVQEAIGNNKEAEQAFRQATLILDDADCTASRVQANLRLARHLIKKGQVAEGNIILEEVQQLSEVVAQTTANA